MILVLLGTQELQFVRLVKEVDDLLAKGTINEEVFVQMGHTDYCSTRFQSKSFMSFSETEEMYEKANLIITHGGVGSILKGLKKRKNIIVCPRLKIFNEHVDDHQLEIARQFETDKFILVWRPGDKLERIIMQSTTFKPRKYLENKGELISDIDYFLRT